MKDRIFICPKNDLEAVTIIDYLQRNGENVLITNQAWGASWENLEPEIKKILEENEARTKVIQVEKEDPSPLDFDSKGKWVVKEYDKTATHMHGGYGTSNLVTKEMYGTHSEYLEQEIKNPEWAAGHVISKSDFERDKILVDEIVPDGVKIYGIELIGGSELKNIENIDHHNENIYKPSSLEQVASVVGEPLSLRERFVGANDSGYIPAMQELAQKEGLSDKEKEFIINDIRLMDRQCQGVTVEQEEIAEKFVNDLNISEKQDLIIIENFPHSKCSTLTDRLYDKNENLLICSSDGEINFFGKSEIVQDLASEFEGWNGKGFWGSTSANKEDVVDYTMFDVSRTIDCASILQVDYNELENNLSNDYNKKNENDNDLEI